MRQQNLDLAIENFRQALQANPNESQVLTFLGACLLDKASKAEEKIKGRITPEAKKELNKYYEEAKDNLEKAKSLAPNDKSSWGYALYRCYYALYGANDDRTKAAEADSK